MLDDLSVTQGSIKPAGVSLPIRIFSLRGPEGDVSVSQGDSRGIHRWNFLTLRQRHDCWQSGMRQVSSSSVYRSDLSLFLRQFVIAPGTFERSECVLFEWSADRMAWRKFAEKFLSTSVGPPMPQLPIITWQSSVGFCPHRYITPICLLALAH